MSYSQAFNTRTGEKTPLIPYARDERTGRSISLPGAHLQPGGDWYRAHEHKGHLICPCCPAKVNFAPARESKGGGNLSGNVAHFRTNPGQSHADDCAIGRKRELAEHDTDESAVDKTRGFRINLNTFNAETVRDLNLTRRFNTASGPYERESATKVRIKEQAQDLKHLESYAAEGVEDLIAFLKSKDFDRIKDSVIIHRDFVIPWKHFMLSYGGGNDRESRNAKFKNFASYMLDRGLKAAPVLMEVITNKPYYRSTLKENPAVKSTSIPISRDQRTQQISWLLPRIYLDNLKTTHFDFIFDKPGKYLVLGMARVHKDGSNVYLSVSVTDPRQIKAADLAEIRAENMKRHGIIPKDSGKSVNDAGTDRISGGPT